MTGVRALDNPFPVEGVATTSIQGVPNLRETASFSQAWPIVENFVEEFPNAASRTHVTLAIRGAYGSGKTHLLLQLLDEFTAGGGPFRLVAPRSGGHAVAFYVKCKGLDLLDLYVNQIVRHLELADLRTVVAGQLAKLLRAQRTVQTAATGNEPALLGIASREVDQRLEENPQLILTLLEHDLLPMTDLPRLAEAELRGASPDFSDSFMRAYAYLTDANLGTVALKWIKGQTLTAGEVKDLGLSVPAIASADHARTALRLLLAMFGHADVRLMLCLDEIERVVPSGSADQKSAASFVKDVAEIFMDAKQCVVFCGMDDAWTAMTLDVFDRIRDVVAVRMTREEVASILELHCQSVGLSRTRLFAADALTLLADVGGRSPRRLLTLAHYAYEAMERRQDRVVNAADVSSSSNRALKVGRNRSAAFQIVSAAAGRQGYRVEQDADVGSARCDLLLSKGVAQIAVFILNSVFKLEELAEARAVAERSREAMNARPRIATAVVVTGYSTAEVRQTLDRLVDRVFLYDEVTFADAVATFLDEQATIAATPPAPPAPTVVMAERAAYTDLERRFNTLEAERSAEVQRLGTLIEDMQRELRLGRTQIRDQRASDKIEQTLGSMRTLLEQERAKAGDIQALLEDQRSLLRKLRLLNDGLPGEASFARALEQFEHLVLAASYENIRERLEVVEHLSVLHAGRRVSGIGQRGVLFAQRHWLSIAAGLSLAASLAVLTAEYSQLRTERAAISEAFLSIQRTAEVTSRLRGLTAASADGVRSEIIKQVAAMVDVRDPSSTFSRVGGPELESEMAPIGRDIDALLDELSLADDAKPADLSFARTIAACRRARTLISGVDLIAAAVSFPRRHRVMSYVVLMLVMGASIRSVGARLREWPPRRPSFER